MSRSNTTLTRVIMLNYVNFSNYYWRISLRVVYVLHMLIVIVVMLFVFTLLGKLKWDQDTVFIESRQ